jgi:alanine dehydrogenase
VTVLLTRTDVEQLLDYGECMGALRSAHISFSSRGAIMPLRLTARFRDRGIMALMPAWLDDGPQLGVKCATSFFANPAKGLPLSTATMLLLDPETGALKAIMVASRITEVRTAAASALATDELARADARQLAIIGAGAQARAHLDAMVRVRDLTSVAVVASTRQSAERFVAYAKERYRTFSALPRTIRTTLFDPPTSSAPSRRRGSRCSARTP